MAIDYASIRADKARTLTFDRGLLDIADLDAELDDPGD